ncbi:hypothetical protein ACFWN7_06665 [Agromyces sp. NPDC058484]|uniref:hypothetical protein n=1 Tax=Agromyces sp. NPDC058484 TaxID=3346524 RepID=UPI00364C0E1D
MTEFVSPWKMSEGFSPDIPALEELLLQRVVDGGDWSSGALAVSLDAWVARELVRSGFPPDEVWPRPDAPAVLPREVGLLLARANPTLRAELLKLIRRTPGVASSDARVLGKAYLKQVDVVMAQWSRGPELMISTKTMMSSFRKNLPNRFEEAYGDAANLRGRYPLAAIGFVFAMRAAALAEPGTVQRAVDMLRKLKDPSTYDATCLILVDVERAQGDSLGIADVLESEVPEDLRSSQFFESMIDRVLDSSPVDMHVRVREQREGRNIAPPHWSLSARPVAACRVSHSRVVISGCVL